MQLPPSDMWREHQGKGYEPVKVWIDIGSGTWGEAKNIRFVQLEHEEVELFDVLTDSERIKVALERGDKPS